MTAKQIKNINRIAEAIAREFITSTEDGASPYVRITDIEALIFAGYKFDNEAGEYVQQLYHTIELNKYDMEELIEDAEGWLLSNIFREMFILITKA